MVVYGRSRHPGTIDPLAMPTSYLNTILEDSPAGLWMLDDTSGTTANDMSGNARHGAYIAGFTLGQAGPGRVGSAVALTGEGSGTGRVTFPASAVSALASDFTMGILVKLDAAGDAWNLLSVVSATQYAQPIQISYGSATMTTNKLTVNIGSSGSAETTLWTDTGSDQGTGWHHIALRASSTTYSLFVDGASIASRTDGAARASSGDVLSLGRRTASSTQRGRSGKYAGLYVVGSALSDATIATHAAAGLAAV